MVQRRRVIAGGAALGATAWVAPSVLTLDRVGAAVGSCIAETPTVGNGAVLIDPPPTIQEGTPGLDSNTNTWVWLEQEAVVLMAPLTVNRVTDGTFNGGSNENATIPTGTQIASYYVHGDRLDDNGNLTGSLNFANASIIGLIYRTAELNASSFLRAPGTTYFNGPSEGGDTMGLSVVPGASDLRWNFRFGPALDGIRVIISCD